MNKKTLILGAVLIALIALAYLYHGPLKEWQNNFGKPKNIFAKIDAAKVDKLEVVSGDNTLVLSKQNEKWRYNNTKDFYVEPSLIAGALESLKQAAASEVELVSNNPERKSEFKTEAGLTVKVYQDGQPVVDFIIGSRASDYDSTYIATAGSSATYSVKADLSGSFNQPEWRDLMIFSTAKEKINKIRFQYPNREFTVEFKDDKWSGILPEKFAVNQEKIGPLLEIMTNLKAAEIPEQTFANTGLDKHLIIIEASGEGVDNVLMIGSAKDELYYAKRGDSDNIYLINKSDRDLLDKWIWQLR